MRPVNRGEWPKDEDGRNVRFREYAEARGELIERLGEYCSYCESLLNASLAVEHVQPKSLNPQLERDWSNFLLACTNCNSTKGDNAIALDDYVWPDRDNTARAFAYEEGGTVKVAQGLDPAVADKAEALRKLVGLDKKPTKDPTASDRRWLHRYRAWERATRALQLLRHRRDDEGMRQLIVDQATALGFWSIWMTVFAEDADMRQRFIESFPGTARDCFDAGAGTMARPGGTL